MIYLNQDYLGDGAIVDMGIAEAPAGEPRPTPTATATATPTLTATPTATATPAAAKLSVSPKALHFAETTVGHTTKLKMVELSNPRTRQQDAPILIENAFLTGSYVMDAAKSTCHVGESLLPGKRCDFAISYTATFSGEQLGTLVIQDNSQVLDQSIVDLKGKGKASK